MQDPAGSMKRVIDYQRVPKDAPQLRDIWDGFYVPHDATWQEVTAALVARAHVPARTEMKVLIGNKWKDVKPSMSSLPLPVGDIKFKILWASGRQLYRGNIGNRGLTNQLHSL